MATDRKDKSTIKVLTKTAKEKDKKFPYGIIFILRGKY
jgi:hypothetical protein